MQAFFFKKKKVMFTGARSVHGHFLFFFYKIEYDHVELIWSVH